MCWRCERITDSSLSILSYWLHTLSISWIKTQRQIYNTILYEFNIHTKDNTPHFCYYIINDGHFFDCRCVAMVCLMWILSLHTNDTSHILARIVTRSSWSKAFWVSASSWAWGPWFCHSSSCILDTSNAQWTLSWNRQNYNRQLLDWTKKKIQTCQNALRDRVQLWPQRESQHLSNFCNWAVTFMFVHSEQLLL